MRQDWPFIRKSQWKQFGWARNLVGQGIPRAGVNSYSQVDGDLYDTCLLILWEKDSEKETWPLPAFLSGRKLPLWPSPWCQTFLFLPMSLVSFDLLPQCWNSEGISLSKFMCGPFKRNCLRLQKPSISLSHSSLRFLRSEVMRSSLPVEFSSLELWAGDPGVGLGPLASRGVLHSQDIPPSICPLHMGVELAHSLSPTLLPVSMWLLYIFCCRTSIQLDVRLFWMMVVL